MRPVFGSDTTTAPFSGPRASTAARRTSRSSPSTLSPKVESAYVGSSHGLPAPRLRALGRKVLEGVATVATNCLLLASDRDQTLAPIRFARSSVTFAASLFFPFLLLPEAIL